MLDLMCNGHTKGKQTMEHVGTQVINKMHTTADAGNMVAVSKHLEPTQLGLGRLENMRSSIFKESETTISSVRLNLRNASLKLSRGLEMGASGSTSVAPSA